MQGHQLRIHVNRAVIITQSKSVCKMLDFKITYRLKEPNSVFMFIESWTYYRVREQSVCNNAHSEGVQNNFLLSCNNNVHCSMYMDTEFGSFSL